VKKSRRGSDGFTLLEMLLAMLLLTIILGAVYSTFFLSHKAVSVVDDSLITLQECRTLLDTMTREIDSSFYRTDRKKSLIKVEDRDIYGKQTSRMTFTSLSPLRPGLSLVTYHVENHDGIMTLYKKMANPYKDEPELKPTEMLDNIEAFMIEVKDGAKWVKTWDTTEIQRVPEEIRITISIKVKEKLITINETVRPKIGRSI